MTPALRNALADRTPRERALLAGLGIVLLLAAWTALVWQPLAARRDALVAQIARHTAAEAALAAQPATADIARVEDRRPVNIVVTESAARQSLPIRRIEVEGPGTRLVIDEVPFDRLILWIEMLERDHALRLSDINLTRRPAPGVVGATLLLER